MEIQRNIKDKLEHFLKVFPVVFLTGARQTGKTTLAKIFAKKKGYFYVTLDDLSMLKAAKEDPKGFLELLSKPCIIDEVQRVPELFLAIKQLVDQENVLGQFLLTGSANPLLLPKLGDSLAGRMGILKMFPFSQGELKGKKENFISWLFSSEIKMKNFNKLEISKLWDIVLKGGFPRVIDFKSFEQIDTWIQSYLQTLMDRDIKDLAQIEGIHHFPDLFKLLASRSSSLLNGADLARTLKISSASVHRYLSLLEAIFIVFREQAWFANHSKRIAKSPKVYICDTGILCYLLKANKEKFKSDPSVFGFVFESFVAAELLKIASWMNERIDQYHFREGTSEVDIVLEERAGHIIGVEIKSSATIKSSDFKGLKRLKEVAKKKFIRGIILYTGSTMVPFGKDLWAIPINSLWES
ncbi:MAG: hypothetical protein K1000chlam1_00464 [Candidatus Anoxychlamydiales bacterium]|nr:hypothetical protein [Candidatus Anoxychlamydiales bacterium]